MTGGSAGDETATDSETVRRIEVLYARADSEQALTLHPARQLGPEDLGLLDDMTVLLSQPSTYAVARRQLRNLVADLAAIQLGEPTVLVLLTSNSGHLSLCT